MKIVATASAPSNTIFQVKQFLFSDVGLLSCIGVAALIALFFLENKGSAKGSPVKVTKSRIIIPSVRRAASATRTDT